MTEYAGSAFLLKTGTVAGGTTVGGFRSNEIQFNNATIDASSKDSGYRKLIAGGQQSVSLSGNGVVSDAASFETFRGYFHGGAVVTLSVVGIGNSLTVEGSFIVTSATITGEYQGEQTFSFTAESAAAPTITGA